MSIVELIQVEKAYQGVAAVKALDLSLQQGEILGLFGHNGAGKTTIIKLILGLIEASAGSVRVFGQDPTQAQARGQRKQLGFLQENVSFYDQLTGLEVLEYFARLKAVPVTECAGLLARVGLSDASKRRVKTYSKGMRQRLGLAQALLGEPKLLLLDEPTVGLDPIATQDFYRTIADLKQHGCTVVLCSHVLPGVEKYIDRALIMGQGQLLAQGSINQLRQQANLSTTFQFSTSSAAFMSELPVKQKLIPNTHGRYELSVPAAEKMSTLHMLTQLEGLEDMDIHLPSLEDLYTHFMQFNPLQGAPS